MLQLAFKLHSSDDPGDRDAGDAGAFSGFPVEHEDLPYRVEVWDTAGKFVEYVVAVSANPAIGYAAYYAAAREYPGRDVTLRHKGRVLSRWTGRAH